MQLARRAADGGVGRLAERPLLLAVAARVLDARLRTRTRSALPRTRRGAWCGRSAAAGYRFASFPYRTGASKEAVTFSVKYLEKHDYVVVAPDPEAPKVKQACLSDKGRDALDAYRQQTAAVEERAGEQFGEHHRSNLRAAAREPIVGDGELRHVTARSGPRATGEDLAGVDETARDAPPSSAGAPSAAATPTAPDSDQRRACSRLETASGEKGTGIPSSPGHMRVADEHEHAAGMVQHRIGSAAPTHGSDRRARSGKGRGTWSASPATCCSTTEPSPIMPAPATCRVISAPCSAGNAIPGSTCGTRSRPPRRDWRRTRASHPHPEARCE